MREEPTLQDTIFAYAQGNPSVQLLGPDQREVLHTLVAKRFGIDADRVWWWDSVASPSTVIDYAQSDALEIVSRLIPSCKDPIYLFVTDDDAPPWMCLMASWDVLARMLRELWSFEYFIVDHGVHWIIFDTHHNTLVYAGDLPMGDI